MYELDTKSARQADTAGASIKELGKYVGRITQARDIVTKKGGRGIALAFTSQSGQKANLAIYTTGANGDRYQGYDTLMAMMTCMQLRGIQPSPGKVTRYDYDQGKEVQEDGTVFAGLHKPIGLLLETEEFEKQDGSIGSRLVVKNVFQADTELTASEILDKKTKPEALEKMVTALRHRPIKGRAQQQSTQEQALHAGHPAAGSGFDDMQSDDVPW